MEHPFAPITVVLVDDHMLFRQSLKLMMSKWDGIEVVGETGDGRDSLKIIAKHKPNVAVLDISMPGLGGLEIAPRILEISPDTEIMVLSMHNDSKHVYKAFRAGVRGYVLKSDSADELERAIKFVSRKQTYLSPVLSSSFIDHFIIHSELEEPLQTPLSNLTQREQEISNLLLQGRSTDNIGHDLCISPKTVRVHIANLMKKLACSTRVELIKKLESLTKVD